MKREEAVQVMERVTKALLDRFEMTLPNASTFVDKNSGGGEVFIYARPKGELKQAPFACLALLPYEFEAFDTEQEAMGHGMVLADKMERLWANGPPKEGE